MLKSFFAAITRFSLRFWWVTVALTVLFLVLGVQSALSLNQELLPNLEFPQTFVITLRPGASSEDLRDLITLPLEEEVAKIPGGVLQGLESTTTAPLALVTIRNEYGVSQQQIRDAIKAAIDKVNAEGVPVGLLTTADLTPEIVTRVISRAPTMFKQFDAEQLLAMSPEVLNAALAAAPNLFDQLDPLTRDQLAAARIDTAVSGETIVREPVTLPDAWKLTEDQLPRLLSFDLGAIPVVSSSISSTDPNVKAEDLRQFVEDEIVKPLEAGAVPGVAEISVSGGQQIPQDVIDAAVIAVAEARKQEAEAATATATPEPTAEPTAAPTETAPTGDPAVPTLSSTWSSPLIAIPLRGVLQVNATFTNADDLLNAKTFSGEDTTVASLFNTIADSETYIPLLRDLSPELLTYLRANEPDFMANLSDKALTAMTSGITASGAWSQLLGQSGIAKLGVTSIADLGKIKGTPSATLNDIVASAPAELRDFAIRLVYSLTPESFELLRRQELDFVSALKPDVLRYLSANTLAALPTGFIDGLSDAQLKSDLQAIIADPSLAPGKASEVPASNTGDLDPNAPPLPESWTKGLKGFGINATQADDLLKKPFGLSAGEFINLSGSSNPASLGELSADVLIYLADHDPNFYDQLTSATLNALNPAVLAQLPPEVQARAQKSFTPTTTITRANGLESLSISVQKESEANTVNVADGIDHFFAELKSKRPDIVITEVFGQAEFIKESISGVAREGGLGAIMAVIVILLFLNFSVRSTLVTAVSIPTSVAIAMVVMKYLPGAVHGFLMQDSIYNALPDAIRTFALRLFPSSITLNIMTLSGLTVAVGRVVDDSIVVLENIYRQLQTQSATADRRQVVIQGTRDVSVAIFAATLTTVVVFLPIGLTGGIVGEFFLPFGLAVTYSLAASFLVAITLVPLLAFVFIRRDNIPEEKEGRLEAGYHNLLEWALSHRVVVLGIAFLTLVFGLYLFSTRPANFLPALGEPQISVAVTMPSGAKIAQTDVRVRELETYLKTLADTDKVSRYQVQIGGGGDLQALLGAGGGVDEGSATISIAPEVHSEAELDALTGELRTKAQEIFGNKAVKVSSATLSEQGFGGFALVISGPEDKLLAIYPRVKEELSKVPGLANVTSTLDQVGGTAAFLRVGRTAAVQFSAELETQNTLGVTQDALEAIRAMPDLPEGVTVGQGFQSEQQTAGFAQTFSSMGIAIVIVYFVMVITFGSFVHPFTILFSLPLAIVGAALGLTLTNRVLGLSAMIGMLMLIGIVVTNAIVMIDRVQANRKERHLPMREALVEGARTRLRPILMTAIATIFALLPLAIGLSEGAIIASELGTVVIGGLFSSTILTLLVVLSHLAA
ncbi:MAG: efflux RND transporter permease subunit [Anaerolineae bacterium]